MHIRCGRLGKGIVAHSRHPIRHDRLTGHCRGTADHRRRGLVDQQTLLHRVDRVVRRHSDDSQPGICGAIEPADQIAGPDQIRHAAAQMDGSQGGLLHPCLCIRLLPGEGNDAHFCHAVRDDHAGQVIVAEGPFPDGRHDMPVQLRWERHILLPAGIAGDLRRTIPQENVGIVPADILFVILLRPCRRQTQQQRQQYDAQPFHALSSFLMMNL